MKPASLLLVATGSVTASFLPFHLSWLRSQHPEVRPTIVLTPAARRFVAPAALAALAGTEIQTDDWSAHPAHRPVHVEWSACDAALVYPATLDFLSKLSAGFGSTPALLALQLMTAPLVVAPALPPGGEASFAYQDAIRNLGRRGNVRVAEPHPGRSAATGGMDASAPAAFEDALALLS